MCRHRIAAGFTLVEVLMVVLLMSVLAGLALPMMNPGIAEQLKSAGQVVAAEMNFARSLAVTNLGTYRYTFDVGSNTFTLQYTGSNPALNTLPSSPFYSAQDSATQQVTNLSNLPNLNANIRLAAVGTAGSSPAPTTQLEFGPYGQTTQSAETDIWLTAGTGSRQGWIFVRVNPVTGLATVQDFQATAPPAAIMSGS
jgi:prepilin-type N-terminal cleavage/methylation domain-containing protein